MIDSEAWSSGVGKKKIDCEQRVCERIYVSYVYEELEILNLITYFYSVY